ncbi:MAG: MFS transporter [Kiritimatiellia bacterium]|nr:MFS transporter [Pseudomonadales bacterium]MDP6470906.1 MFS transporter [Pseudomonadales bacterium]MDP6825909.1 MFS transporter [Pseudomonadales bacterium]MDP7024551.1 MFS transporter [Kiritimatiellia bacterium]
MLAIAFLGFSAGLPFLLVFSTLSAWLTEYGVSRSTIGFFSWIGITYSVKVFWAPVVDRMRLPGLTRLLGQRRSWMLVAQIGIAAGLFAMAATDPSADLVRLALLGLLVAFSSATQDITIDAYRIEAVEEERQAAMAAAYIFGYRLALLFAGAGALYIAEFASWHAAYLGMALAAGVGICTTLVIAEPERIIASATRELEARVVEFSNRRAHWPQALRRLGEWFVGAVICPFLDFFQRNGVVLALILLALVGTYRISDITMGVMANPFYLDLGFTKTEIANVVKIFGFGMTIAGSAIGGLVVVRLGLARTLLLGAVLVAATNLLFALMAGVGPERALLALVISADNFSGGLANVVFIAFLSGLTNTAYTATQYALFSSLMTLPGKFVGGYAGVVVDAAGYAPFFIYAGLLGVPAIALVLWLMKRHADLFERAAQTIPHPRETS